MVTWEEKWDMTVHLKTTTRSEKLVISVVTPKSKKRLKKKDVKDALLLAIEGLERGDAPYKNIGDVE